MSLDKALGPERATLFWQLAGAYESIWNQYQTDPEGAHDRIDALSEAEAHAYLKLSLHALTKARTGSA